MENRIKRSLRRKLMKVRKKRRRRLVRIMRVKMINSRDKDINRGNSIGKKEK